MHTLAVPMGVPVVVSAAPAYTALTSLALLNHVDQLAELSAWVTRTATSLPAARRFVNRLVLDGVGHALVTDENWPDVPHYLAYLRSLSPTDLQARVVERLAASPCGSTSGVRRPLSAAQNKDGQEYSSQPYHADHDLQDDVEREVQRLVADPTALHDVVVSHLDTMWQTVVLPEWPRMQSAWTVQTLQQRLASGEGGDSLSTFIGHDLSAAHVACLGGAVRIVLVPSTHVGSNIHIWRSETTAWLFFDVTQDRAMLLRSGPVLESELVIRMDAVADETRLRILQLIARTDSISAQDIIAELGLAQPTASRHLRYLVTAGYVQERRDGGPLKRYRLRPTHTAATFQALQRFLARSEAPADARIDLPPALQRFLDSSGRLRQWPTKEHDRSRALHYLADRFVVGQPYTEHDVNTLLNQWHTFGDPATLRRTLVEYKLLQRQRDGTRYWRPEPQPPN